MAAFCQSPLLEYKFLQDWSNSCLKLLTWPAGLQYTQKRVWQYIAGIKVLKWRLLPVSIQVSDEFSIFASVTMSVGIVTLANMQKWITVFNASLDERCTV